MNIHVPQGEMARAEALQLMMVDRLIVSPQANKPIIGPVQNELLGISLFTQRDIFLTHAQAMAVVMHIEGFNGVNVASLPFPAILHPAPLWTGKQLLSLLLPHTLTTSTVATMHPKSLPSDDPMTPSDTVVCMQRGELLSGRLCKRTAGMSGGGLIHITFLDYGTTLCSELINGMQRIANHWMPTQGYSIGVRDMVIDAETQGKVTNILDKAIKDVKHMWRGFDPKLESAAKRERQTNVKLNQALDMAAEVAQAGLDPKNNVRRMTDVPSKGNKLNMTQIVASVGQQNVEGARIPFGFTDRTTPHFAKHDHGAASGGFIRNSYLKGLSALEFFFHCMAGREGLIDTAVKTAKSGYIQRRLMKAHEDIMVHHDGSVRNSLNNIIQYVYGEDGFDATYMEFQPAKLGSMSYAAFEAEYKWTGTVGRRKAAREEFARLCQARTVVQEAMLARDEDRLPLAVGMQRLVTRFTQDAAYADQPPMTDERLAIAHFEAFRTHLSVLPLSSGLERYRDINESATLLFLAHVLTYMASKPMLEQHRVSEACYVAMLEEVRTRFQQALVQPGEMVGPVAAHSIVQPATQMTLNTFHYTGISSKNQTSGMPRLEEIIKVSKTTKTPAMVIFTKDGTATSYEDTIELANLLNHTCLADLVQDYAILNDPDPVTTATVIEADRDAVETYYMLPDEAIDHLDLEPFVLRLVLLRDQLIDRSITLASVQAQVRAYLRTNSKDNTFVVFTNDENDETLFLRIRPARVKQNATTTTTTTKQPAAKRRKRNTTTKAPPPQPDDDEAATKPDPVMVLLEQTIDLLAGDDVTIQGIPRVRDCEVREARVKKLRDGNIVTESEYVVDTLGSNLEAVWQCDGVDPRRTGSNEIIETLQTLGIEACRSLLHRELERVLSFDYINYRHLSVLIDVMTHRGYLMPMSRHGLNRMGTGPLKRSSFEETYEMLLEAAMFAECDELSGISENIMTGNLAPMGTGFMKLLPTTTTTTTTTKHVTFGPATAMLPTLGTPVDVQDAYLDDEVTSLLSFDDEDDEEDEEDEDEEDEDAMFGDFAGADDEDEDEDAADEFDM